ncbi:hypothetical protein FQN49_003248 [Arthroderma sp. PD_2]|nr:hypothetical protein FQN49_003248 [Arthroderma sp. PD_2]
MGAASILPRRAIRQSVCSRCLARSAYLSRQTRYSSTAHNNSSTSSTKDSDKGNGSGKTMVLTPSQRAYLSRALRVNHAGELAATLIYSAQTPPVVRSHPHLRPLMKHMYDQEAGHFSIFNEMLATHRVRPTAMYPVWQAAATFLGWSTGVMGREAAMACTEAVETEIGTHYNDQIRVIVGWMEDAEAKGEVVPSELQQLVKTLKRIRDEELEHLDHAVENDAKEAKPYEPLIGVVRLGCRAAIQITQRI